jgi:hypothetical protein
MKYKCKLRNAQTTNIIFFQWLLISLIYEKIVLFHEVLFFVELVADLCCLKYV